LTPARVYFDRGFHSSTAINENGVILDVHESGHSSSSTGLYDRVGHFTDLAGGNYTIVWDSGVSGKSYDDGINPHVALNNYNAVVEVHQVTGENLMHYRRGTVNGGTISFGDSPRYDSNAGEAAVALLDSGQVVELHRSGGRAYARTGSLRLHSTARIEWSSSVEISDAASDAARYPAVATNGTYAVGTWTSYSFDITGELYSSTALLAPQEVVTPALFECQGMFLPEWDFPARVRPRRTHRTLKDRSPAPQTTVQLKSESPGGASPGRTHAKANELSPAPQTTVQSKTESPGSASHGWTRENLNHPRSNPRRIHP
jgi:hypothetical protein